MICELSTMIVCYFEVLIYIWYVRQLPVNTKIMFSKIDKYTHTHNPALSLVHSIMQLFGYIIGLQIEYVE